MNKNKIVAHIGLGLVTYIPLFLYILFVTTMTSDVVEVFGSGLLAFFGFFATTMMMFGWLFWIASLIIAIISLAKRNNLAINIVTLAVCGGWLVVGYWVVTHFR